MISCFTYMENASIVIHNLKGERVNLFPVLSKQCDELHIHVSLVFRITCLSVNSTDRFFFGIAVFLSLSGISVK